MTQYGWQDDGSFLVGPRRYAAGATCKESLHAERDRHFSLRGSLEAWTNEADKLCAPGLEAVQFALLCAPASVLLKLADAELGHAAFSMTSKASASAKNLAFEASASFWGDMPALAIKNTSAAALFGFNKSLPAYFDEAAQRDGEEMRRFLTELSGPPFLLICASHGSLIELLRTAEGGEEMTKHVLEAHPSLPDHLPKDATVKIARTLKKNSAQAGDRFMRYIMEIPGVIDYVRIRMRKAPAEIMKQGNLGGDGQFWIRLIAAVQVAGELVRACNVLHCNPQRMAEWGIEQARAQLGDSGIRGPNAALLEYLQANLNDILTIELLTGKGHTTSDAVIYHRPIRDTIGRFEPGLKRLFLSVPKFRKWVNNTNYSWTDTIEEMRKTGILYASRLLTLNRGVPDMPADAKRQHECLCINTEFIGLRFDKRSRSNAMRIGSRPDLPAPASGPGAGSHARVATPREQPTPKSSP